MTAYNYHITRNCSVPNYKCILYVDYLLNTSKKFTFMQLTCNCRTIVALINPHNSSHTAIPSSARQEP